MVDELAVVGACGPDSAAEAGHRPHAVRVGSAAARGLGAKRGEGQSARRQGNRRAHDGRRRGGGGEVGGLGIHEVPAIHALFFHFTVDPGGRDVFAVFVGVLEEVKGAAIGAVRSFRIVIVVVINGAERDEGIVQGQCVAGVVFADGQQPVVQF